MRGLHLKRRGQHWHYQRRRPTEFEDIEPRALISFSLKTTDFGEARLRAAAYSVKLEDRWRRAKETMSAMASEAPGERYAAAIALAREQGFAYRPADALDEGELIERLRSLLPKSDEQADAPEASSPSFPKQPEDAAPTKPQIAEAAQINSQKAVLGLVSEPKLTLSEGFDRFWDHIKDEWMRLSADQRRTKRNIYLKAIRNFEAQTGPVSLYGIRREHALKFRAWHLSRVEAEGLKPYTGNREINSLRRLLAVNYDIDSQERVNPFARVRLRDDHQGGRAPFSSEFLRDGLLAPNALIDLPEALQVLVRLLVNTGMRPSEAIGLAAADIDLEHEVPHVHIRRNAIRSLKTDHSERLIPLVGVSLEAAQDLVRIGGRWPDELKKFCAETAAVSPWGRWAGKNMYATTLINRHFRESGLVTDPAQSLYSLRHWFQDQLTRLNVIDRAQAQLMGHKFQRPKYGYGKDLAELHGIVDQFAIVQEDVSLCGKNE